MTQVPLVLHPELGEGAAADHGHAREHARGHQAARDRQRVDGPAAEALDVHPGGAHAAGLLGHRLRQVPAAALIAVAHRLLAAADHVVDGPGIDALARRAARAAPWPPSPWRRGSRAARRRRASGRPRDPPRCSRRAGPSAGGAAAAARARPSARRSRRSGSPAPRAPGRRRDQRMRRERRVRLVGEARLELHEVELVADLEETEQLLLGRDLAVRPAPVCRRRRLEPGPRQVPERVGMARAEQHLVRGIVARGFPRAKRRAIEPSTRASTAMSRLGLEPWRTRPGAWARKKRTPRITGLAQGAAAPSGSRLLLIGPLARLVARHSIQLCVPNP